jgi:hypothetical protein
MHGRAIVSVAALTLGLVSISACASDAKSRDGKSGAATAAESAEGETQARADRSDSLVPPGPWVEARVEEARERLQGSEAGKIAWASIEAHGGLADWFSNGPLFFRFTYRPLAGGKVRDTYQTVDTWSSRARHRLASDETREFGWDGERAWQMTEEGELAINARFWALTPFYFIAIPFVLADPGVELEETGSAELEGRAYDLLKVTYGSGVGDSPDDYYIVYIDAETKRVGAVRYIVSYPGFFPEGGHSPEKLMIYDGEQRAGGILFAKTFRTFEWDGGERGSLVTKIEMTDVAFRPETSVDFFEAPEGATYQEGY